MRFHGQKPSNLLLRKDFFIFRRSAGGGFYTRLSRWQIYLLVIACEIYQN